jgi:SAM-dependent methyltransferase
MMPLLEEVRRLKVSDVVSPGDRMMQPGPLSLQHYLYSGRSTLLTVLNVLSIRSIYPRGDGRIEDIFDFGCGHGRVARWFRVAFPNSQVHVTDIDKSAMEFCIDKFGCREIAGDIPAGRFDLVWLGSVFTHLSAQVVEALLQKLLASLRPNGVLVFTSQGRFSIERMKDFDWDKDNRHWMHYNLDRAGFESVVTQYRETGYGYVDFAGQTNQGVCIAEPTWYSERVLKSNEFIQILFQEKGINHHQDVSAFMRTALLDTSVGPAWRPHAEAAAEANLPGKRSGLIVAMVRKSTR